MANISILDVTLRDGGYINNWEFKNKTILQIINALISSNIETIECGYLDPKKGKNIDSTMFDSVESIDNLIKNISDTTNFVAMVNSGSYDVNNLPLRQNTRLDGIRIAFHQENIDEAIKNTEVLIQKGYDTYIQPMVTSRYSDYELLNLIKRVNGLGVYSFYIVDSFGAFSKMDFNRLFYLVDHNLDKDIKLGFHSHNNLQLAFSNAIEMTESLKTRDLIIDSSIHGMGRGAGNLNTELLADYLNKNVENKYKITPLLEIIDQYIESLHRKLFWGYSTAHFLSAATNCHPNYSSYYLAKKSLSVVAIEDILGHLDKGKISIFDKEYAENVYQNYIKENEPLPNISDTLFAERNILVLVPGASIKDSSEKINNYINQYKPVTVSVNFIPQAYSPDYVFFANQKRYNEFLNEIPAEKLIITSNINLHDKHKNAIICDYTDCLEKVPNKFYNATLLLLSQLFSQNACKVVLAGFDGYTFDKENQYAYDRLDVEYDLEHMKEANENIAIAMDKLIDKHDISFITDSIYDKKCIK